MKTIEELSEEYKKKFGYAGSSGTFQGMRDDEILKWSFSLLNAAKQEGRDEACYVIEADGEWVKEDVADGNYGYFRADQKLLNQARHPQGELVDEKK